MFPLPFLPRRVVRHEWMDGRTDGRINITRRMHTPSICLSFTTYRYYKPAQTRAKLTFPGRPRHENQGMAVRLALPTMTIRMAETNKFPKSAS